LKGCKTNDLKLGDNCIPCVALLKWLSYLPTVSRSNKGDNTLSMPLPFSVRCNIYISRLCYDVSVRLSVTEVHWRIIANLGFKFRSHFTTHCGRRAACGQIISRRARLSSWCFP